MNTNRLTISLFFLIILFSITVRCWKITQPVADWHSFRQADTASVARVFTQRGIDLLHPRYHDLSNIQSGKDNPEGWRMVEFPMYQGIAAFLYSIFPFVTIEIWLRILTILASALTGLFLGLMVRKRSGTLAGMITSASYALLPYSIFYGRVILPDPIMVFLAITALYLMDVAPMRRSWGRVLVSTCIAGLAFLVKPYALFLLLPWLTFIIEKPYCKHHVLKIIIGTITVCTPIILWRGWIQGFPEGIPASDWLLNKDAIRFKGAWFYWLFFERVGELILGAWGLIPFGIGLMVKDKKNDWFFPLLLLGSLSYLVVIAGGNVQHDYYQILLLPAITVYFGKGFAYLWGVRDGVNPFISRGLALVTCIFLFAFSWYTVRTYYWINKPEIIEAGNAADTLLPKDAKIIAPYMGDTTFLYQTKRIGWPLNFEIDKKIAMGATHYVTISPTDNDLETKELAEKYTVLVRNEKYAIIDLTRIK